MSPDELRARILACNACVLSMPTGVTPVPWHGPTPAEVVVIGEAPGAHENSLGRPFIGPAGRKARSWLTNAGIDPESVAWMNTVCCYPPGTPGHNEIIACSDNLRDQLGLLQPRAVLLLGQIALGSFWATPIRTTHGLWWRDERRAFWGMAIYHPSYVLRQPSMNETVQGEVRLFAAGLKMIRAGAAPIGFDRCPVCGGPEAVRRWRGMQVCATCKLPEEIIEEHFGELDAGR